MEAVFFDSQTDFRAWLVQNHHTETELIVGFYKVGSGKQNMTWSQSVDEALCFGWIDGVRKSIDKERYQIRFTKRKPQSIWSAVNIKKMAELTKLGHMQSSGLASFEKRKESKSKIYSYEQAEIEFPVEFEDIFKANEQAWLYFQALAPSYKKVSKKWVMEAKQETTRLKRLAILIRDSENETNQWKDSKYKKS